VSALTPTGGIPVVDAPRPTGDDNVTERIGTVR